MKSESVIYVRIYVDPSTYKIVMCETDMLPITRPVIKLTGIDPETGQLTQIQKFIIICFEVEDLTDGNLPQIKAKEFAEDVSDDSEAVFGESIIRVKDDLSVVFDRKKAKNNLGHFKNLRGMKIRNCEIIDYGT